MEAKGGRGVKIKMKAVYIDGSWIEGVRPGLNAWKESPGVHHLDVTAASNDLLHLVGCRVAVPIVGYTKYWVIKEAAE